MLYLTVVRTEPYWESSFHNTIISAADSQGLLRFAFSHDFIQAKSCFEPSGKGSGKYQRLRGNAWKNCPGRKLPLPQKRVIKSFRKAAKQGKALELGLKVM